MPNILEVEKEFINLLQHSILIYFILNKIFIFKIKRCYKTPFNFLFFFL